MIRGICHFQDLLFNTLSDRLVSNGSAFSILVGFNP